MRRFAIALGWHAAPALPAAVGLWNLGEGNCLFRAILLLGWWLGTAANVRPAEHGRGRGNHPMLVPWHYRLRAVLAAGDLWPGTGFGGIALTVLALGGLSAAMTVRAQAAGDRNRLQFRRHGLGHIHPLPTKRLRGDVREVRHQP